MCVGTTSKAKPSVRHIGVMCVADFYGGSSCRESSVEVSWYLSLSLSLSLSHEKHQVIHRLTIFTFSLTHPPTHPDCGMKVHRMCMTDGIIDCEDWRAKTRVGTNSECICKSI